MSAADGRQHAEPAGAFIRLNRSALWLLATLLVLGGSYGAVRTLLHKDAPRPPDLEAMRQANQVLAYAEELHALYDEFANHPVPASVGAKAQWRQWIDRDFRPRVNDARERLVRAELSGEAYTAVLAAADRLASLAASPETLQVREAARRQIQVASSIARNEANRLGAS